MSILHAIIMEKHRHVFLCYTVSMLMILSQNALCLPVETMSIPAEQKVGQPCTKLADSYAAERDRILLMEQHEAVGGDIVLTSDEQKVDAYLLESKKKEINDSLNDGKPFAPGISFLLSKGMYENSAVFKLIKKMPKGGALHTHDVSIADVSWLISNVTYRDNCYMCRDVNNSISFKFFTSQSRLYDSMILNKENIHQDINQVWRRFEEVLIRAEGLINHVPVFQDYCYEALRELNQDNVQYLEIRALLGNDDMDQDETAKKVHLRSVSSTTYYQFNPTKPCLLQVYDLDGTVHRSKAFVLDLYDKALQRFKADYPEFTDLRIIMTSLRVLSPGQILADVKTAMQLIQYKPQLFAGYDLVGQEDPGKPLLYYLDDLQYPFKQNPPIKLPYFFHAGETDWEGTRVDDNVIDAVLLNTTRIGHGYALLKHPEVMRIIKDRYIGIEVNPISNQVLKLVDDLRNHPASALIAQNYPVVISSDDPAVWGATGLSHDFYAAFMALTGADDGLKVLKQLAMNSLIYSSLPQQRRVTAIQDWQKKWNTFVADVITDQSL